MSEANWYYVDRSQQRNGPVTAAAVVEAFGFGWIDDNSLVWREGLGAWAPLAAHRAELGIAGPPTAPPAYAGPGAYPAPQKSSKNLGCMIVGIVALVGGVPVVAILAAIALPAYQDYVGRSQVAGALADIRGYVTVAEEFHQRNERCPADLSEIGADAEISHSEGRATAVSVGEDYAGNCRISGRIVGGNPAVDGSTVSLTRDEIGQWNCTVNVSRPKYLPTGCSLE